MVEDKEFNQEVLKLLKLFTNAQQSINHVEIEGYTLTCTFRFEKRAYYEIRHGERFVYESASLLDALKRVFDDMAKVELGNDPQTPTTP